VSHDLRLERVFDAPPEIVFDAYTDPDAQKEMYGDEPDWIVNRSATCASAAGGASR
jgi:uncharacterized protein YndB with AHSA1/START domain